MNKLLTLIFCAAMVVAASTDSLYAQAKPTTPAKPTESQPTESMQEMYDKLHGNTNKKPTQSTGKSKPATTKPQTTQKPKEAPKPAAPAAAPSEEGGFKFRVGLRGGANYSTITPGEVLASGEKINYFLGYHGGLILNLGTEAFSVQPEILYSQLGFKGETTLGTQKITLQQTVNTLTVPVLLKVALGGGNMKFFVNAGGYGTYALDGKSKITINGATSTHKINFENGDSLIEYGAVGGEGVSLGLGAAKLLIEGRYYYGLGNDDKDTPKADKSFVRNIQGSIGILIPLGG